MGSEPKTPSFWLICTGFGLLLACSPLSSAIEAVVLTVQFSVGVSGWADQVVFAVFFTGSIVVMDRVGKGALSVVAHRRLLGAALGLVELGMVAIALRMGGGDFPPILMTLSSAVRGAGVAVLHTAFFEVLVVLSPRLRRFDALLPVMLVIAALATLLVWGCVWQGWGLAAALVLAAFPLAAWAILLRCSAGCPPSVPVSSPRAATRIDMPPSTRIILGSFGVAEGCLWVVLYLMPDQGLAFCSCLGFLVFGVAAFAIVRMVPAGKALAFGMMLRGVMLLSATAFLLLPVLMPRCPQVSIFVMALSWAAQVLVLVLVPVRMIDKLPVGFLSVAAAGSLPVSIGIVASSVIAGAILALTGPVTYGLSIITALACFVLLVAALLMPPRGFDASALGVREHMEGESAAEQLERRVEVVAQKGGLTKREQEVMMLLVQGLSRPKIAQVLTVSEQTVKTHAKHIYEKLGVHSLREMVTLVETGRRYRDGG